MPASLTISTKVDRATSLFVAPLVMTNMNIVAVAIFVLTDELALERTDFWSHDFFRTARFGIRGDLVSNFLWSGRTGRFNDEALSPTPHKVRQIPFEISSLLRPPELDLIGLLKSLRMVDEDQSSMGFLGVHFCVL